MGTRCYHCGEKTGRCYDCGCASCASCASCEGPDSGHCCGPAPLDELYDAIDAPTELDAEALRTAPGVTGAPIERLEGGPTQAPSVP